MTAMARPRKLDPKKSLEVALEEATRLFPADRIREVAEASGFTQRLRKIDPVLFFWNLILGFSCSAQRTLTSLHRQLEKISEREFAPSSFFDRFSPKLVEFLRTLLEQSLSSFARESLPGGLAGKFQDVSMFDNTVVSLCDSLAKEYPGISSPAGVKITTVMSVATQSASSFKIVSGNTPEIDTITPGPWMRDHLLLFDLGFFKYQFFARIIENRGHFISRLKRRANPHIVGVHRQWRGRTIDLVGQDLRDIESRLKREEIDVEVEFDFKRRTYRGKASSDTMRLRLVGIMNEESGEYHFYLTDLPHEDFPPKVIRQLYRGRWFIELLFKELKSRYALEALSTTKKEVVQALIYSAMLTLTVSKAMFLAYRAHLRLSNVEVTPLRWAIVFYEGARDVMHRILKRCGVDSSMEALMELAFLEAKDPTPGRKRLQDVWEF